MPASVHVIDEDSILAIDAALATGRPLLVRGEPGTGKSQLARAAAESLGRAFLPSSVDARSEARDLLYSVDAVARLAEAQVLGAIHGIDREQVQRNIDIARFIQPGPLWWAFAWSSAREQARRAGLAEPATPPGFEPEHGVVLLVDEIDKADPSMPNGLLDALGHGRFDVAPGIDPVAIDRTRPPLVIITTNEERALPDAFLRRCLVLHLSLPEDPVALQETLIQRGRAHFDRKRCSDQVLAEAARLLALDRAELRQQDLAPPGLAEFIDLITAVIEQRKTRDGQLALLERVAGFALRKHPQEPRR